MNWFNSNAIMWIGIVCIVLGNQYFHYIRHASRNRMLEKLAEHGQSLPPAVMAEMLGQKKDDNGGYAFTGAFILMGVGIALALFFWALTGGGGYFAAQPGVPTWLPVVGIFPFVVGVARLFGVVFDKRRTK